MSAPNQGWTLIEMAAVSVVVGILAAIAFPSMSAIQARSQLRNATSEVKSALQEAQRSAIKRGATCRATITTATSAITSPTVGCLSSSVNIPQKYNNGSTTNGITLSLSPSATSLNIDFSYKGNPDIANEQVIILNSTGTSDVRCLAIAPGLGIMRSGSYSGGTCTTGV